MIIKIAFSQVEKDCILKICNFLNKQFSFGFNEEEIMNKGLNKSDWERLIWLLKKKEVISFSDQSESFIKDEILNLREKIETSI